MGHGHSGPQARICLRAEGTELRSWSPSSSSHSGSSSLILRVNDLPALNYSFSMHNMWPVNTALSSSPRYWEAQGDMGGMCFSYKEMHRLGKVMVKTKTQMSLII